MSMASRAACILAATLFFAGCTTLRPLEDFSPTLIREVVQAGDEVEIVTMKGTKYELDVTLVDEESIHGTTASGKRYVVKFEAIRAIRVERVSGLRTAGAVGVTTYVVLMGAIIYALSAL